MNHGDNAVEFFCKGYNCAQSTAAAFAEESGIKPESALVMTAGFGGGMGGTRETCGAVTGMIFALGALYGPYDPQDNAAKTELYTRIRAAMEEFKKKFGTTCCRELLLKAGCLPKPDPSVRNAKYYSARPCAHFVREAAEIAARLGKRKDS